MRWSAGLGGMGGPLIEENFHAVDARDRTGEVEVGIITEHERGAKRK